MLPYSDSKLTRAGLIAFFIIIVLYGLYEAQGLLFGPRIAIASEAITVNDPYIEIAGKADRIASLSMNGKAVPVTEKGEFRQPYVLAKGDNRIMFEAKDTYGRSASQVVEIFYIPTETPIAETSTTTENLVE